MAIVNVEFSKNGNCWETVPYKASGGDIRVRVHKAEPYPVEVLVSIDGVEEYLRHDDFGMDALKCEVTMQGVIPGLYIKLRSRGEFTLVKYLEM